MFKIERKIVEFVERNVNILFMLAITGLAIVVRYAGRDFVSGDMTWFLLGWFQKIADNGGIHSLKDQVGDYNILYQTIVAIFTYIGDKSIYYYKILSIFFDFCMAISAAIFKEICRKAEVEVQSYVNRSDIPGGSTLGNISNSHISLNTVDIGLAQLAMHSPYETAGVKDTEYMIKAVKKFYETAIMADEEGI